MSTTEFDQAIADIAAKHDVSEQAVLNIKKNTPRLAAFDPLDPQGTWDPIHDFTSSGGAGDISGQSFANPAFQLSDSMIEAIRASWKKDDVDERGGITGALLGVGETILTAIDLPRAGVVSTIKEVGDIFDPGEQFSLNEWGSQLGLGEERAIGFGDVIHDWAPGLGEIEMFGVKPLDNIAGFIGDVALDPFTWLTLGTLPLAKQGSMGVVKMLDALGDTAKARAVMKNGIRAMSGDDLARLTVAARSKGWIGAADELKGGIQFRIPGSKTLSRLHSGPTKAKQLQLMSQDNMLLRFTPRMGANTVAQRIRLSALGGFFGGDRNLLKTALRDPNVSDEVWRGAFHGILADNVGRGIEKSLDNSLTQAWNVLEQKIIKEGVSGKVAYRAMGMDVAPDGMSQELFEALTTFSDEVLKQSNDIMRESMDGVDWLVRRSNWQPTYRTQEFRLWLKEARKSEPSGSMFDMQGFEKEANIVAGGEFMGVPLVDASEDAARRGILLDDGTVDVAKGRGPREQAVNILEENAAENGYGHDEIFDWFEEDLFVAMPQHIKLLSRRARGKYVERNLRKVGVNLDRTVTLDAAVRQARDYRQVDEVLNDLNLQIEELEAAAVLEREAADAARDAGVPFAKRGVDLENKIIETLRWHADQAKKAAKFGVTWVPPSKNGTIWRQMAEESLEDAERIGRLADQRSDEAFNNIEVLKDAAAALERRADYLEGELERIKGGVAKLRARQAELRLEQYELYEKIELQVSQGTRAALKDLARLDEIAQDLRDINEPLAAARTSFLLQAGEIEDAQEVIRTSAKIIAGSKNVESELKELKRLFQLKKGFPSHHAAQDAWEQQISALMDEMGIPIARRPTTYEALIEFEKDIGRARRAAGRNVAVARKVMNAATSEHTDLKAWQKEMVDERDRLIAQLGDDLPPEVAEEIRLSLETLVPTKDGYMSFDGSTALYHGMNQNHAEIDLNKVPDNASRSTSEIDSIGSIHLSFDYGIGLQYASDPSKILGFRMVAKNPVIYGGSGDDFLHGHTALWGQSSQSHRGRGLAQLHVDMVDSGVRNGHITLEHLQAMGVPNAKRIWDLIGGAPQRPYVPILPLADSLPKRMSRGELDAIAQNLPDARPRGRDLFERWKRGPHPRDATDGFADLDAAEQAYRIENWETGYERSGTGPGFDKVESLLEIQVGQLFDDDLWETGDWITTLDISDWADAPGTGDVLADVREMREQLYLSAQVRMGDIQELRPVIDSGEGTIGVWVKTSDLAGDTDEVIPTQIYAPDDKANLVLVQIPPEAVRHITSTTSNPKAIVNKSILIQARTNMDNAKAAVEKSLRVEELIGAQSGVKLSYSEAAAIVGDDGTQDFPITGIIAELRNAHMTAARRGQQVGGTMADHDSGAVEILARGGMDVLTSQGSHDAAGILNALALEDPTLLGRLKYKRSPGTGNRSAGPDGPLSKEGVLKEERWIANLIVNAKRNGVEPLERIPLTPKQLVEDPNGQWFNTYIKPVSSNQWIGGNAGTGLPNMSLGGSQLQKDFADGLMDWVADFHRELRAEGYDSILYTGFEHGGQWNAIALDPKKQLQPFAGGADELTPKNKDSLNASMMGDEDTSKSFGTSREFGEQLDDTASGSGAGASAIGSSPKNRIRYQSRMDVDKALNSASLGSEAASKKTAAFNEYSTITDRVESTLADFEFTIDDWITQNFGDGRHPEQVLKNLTSARGELAQEIGALSKVADKIEAIDPAQAAAMAAPLRQQIDMLRKYLSDTTQVSWGIGRAFSEAKRVGAKNLQVRTAKQFVGLIDESMLALEARKVKRYQEIADAADEISPFVAEAQGSVRQAVEQLAENQRRIAQIDADMAEEATTADGSVAWFRSEELRLRGEATERFEMANRLDNEELEAAERARRATVTDVSMDGVPVLRPSERVASVEVPNAEAGRIADMRVERAAQTVSLNQTNAQFLRLEANAKMLEADLARLSHDRDLIATRFATMSMPESTETLSAVMRGFTAFGVDGQIPEEVAQGLADVNRIIGARGSNSVVTVFDKVNDLFKSWAIASPGFHSRNFFGGVFNNALAGVELSSYGRFHQLYKPVRRAIDAGGSVDEQVAALRGSKQAQRLIDSGNGRFVDHMATLLRNGVLNGGQTTELQRVARARSINPLNPNNVVTATARRPALHVENMLRGTLAMDRLTKGLDIDLAVADVYKYHFDYDDLSAFERGVMRRAIPFYTWTRKNLPLQLEMMFKNPKVYNRVHSLKRELERDSEKETLLPKWIEDRFHIQLPMSMGGDSVFLVPDLPFAELDRAMNPRLIIGASSPLVKIPLSEIADKNFFFDSDFRDDYKPLPKAWDTVLAPLMPALHGVGMVGRREDGEWVATDRNMHHLESTLPIFSALRRLWPTLGDEKTESRTMQNWVNWTSGIGFRRITEDQRKWEQWRRDNAEWLDR